MKVLRVFVCATVILAVSLHRTAAAERRNDILQVLIDRARERERLLDNYDAVWRKEITPAEGLPRTLTEHRRVSGVRFFQEAEETWKMLNGKEVTRLSRAATDDVVARMMWPNDGFGSGGDCPEAQSADSWIDGALRHRVPGRHTGPTVARAA